MHYSSFAQESWPDVNAVRELLTKAKRATKGREADSRLKPYVSPNLKKFLPDYCDDFVPVSTEGAVRSLAPRKEGWLSLGWWSVAWTRYGFHVISPFCCTCLFGPFYI